MADFTTDPIFTTTPTTTKKKTAARPKATISQIGQAQYMQQLESTYMGLWGLPSPPGYVERIAASHMNLYEFEQHERAKPAFSRSPKYQEERIGTQLDLANKLGALG